MNSRKNHEVRVCELTSEASAQLDAACAIVDEIVNEVRAKQHPDATGDLTSAECWDFVGWMSYEGIDFASCRQEYFRTHSELFAFAAVGARWLCAEHGFTLVSVLDTAETYVQHQSIALTHKNIRGPVPIEALYLRPEWNGDPAWEIETPHRIEDAVDSLLRLSRSRRGPHPVDPWPELLGPWIELIR